MHRLFLVLLGMVFLFGTARQTRACSCSSTPGFLDVIRRLQAAGDRPFTVVLTELLPATSGTATSLVRVIRHYDSKESRDTLPIVFTTDCDVVLHSRYGAGDTLLLVLTGFNDSTGRYIVTACGCASLKMVNGESTDNCTGLPIGTPLAAIEDSLRRLSLSVPPFCGTDRPPAPGYVLAPNPAIGTTTLQRNELPSGTVSIVVYTSTGVPVIRVQEPVQRPYGAAAWTLNIAHLTPGRYWVRVQDAATVQTIPLVVGVAGR